MSEMPPEVPEEQVPENTEELNLSPEEIEALPDDTPPEWDGESEDE